MRGLWQRCQGGPMSQDDLLAQLQLSSGRDFQGELARWVHGTQDLPLKELLQAHGVAVLDEPDVWAQRLGLRVDESQGLKIKTVLHGGAAHAAGLSAGDEWLGIERGRAGAWRLHKLDDLALYARGGDKIAALVSRDDQLLRLPLRLPQPGSTWRLAVQDGAQLDRWLAGDRAAGR
jgi:predicted metalloprotease with PDZ domain